jgi:ABC-2 type transport system ATP-binding protein
MSGPAIEFSGVSKWFGPVVAVSDVSFTIGTGITSLLGPNGAGKSTVMRLLCGLTAPSAGSVKVFGRDPRSDAEVFASIGLVPQQESIIEPITCLRFVTLAARLSGVANPEVTAAEAVSTVELDPTDERPLSMYSKGMRQRVKVAAAIVHQPQLLVLDEPLNGLDPRQRLRMIELFQSIGTQGRSVVVASHVLEEVERFGSRILLIAEGRLAAEGEFTEIRALMDDRPLRIRVRCSDPRVLGSELLKSSSITSLKVEADALIVDTVEVTTCRKDIARACADTKVRLLEVLPLDDDLESVFRYLVARRY